jgi:hypothetical protein
MVRAARSPEKLGSDAAAVNPSQEPDFEDDE